MDQEEEREITSFFVVDDKEKIELIINLFKLKAKT